MNTYTHDELKRLNTELIERLKIGYPLIFGDVYNAKKFIIENEPATLFHFPSEVLKNAADEKLTDTTFISFVDISEQAQKYSAFMYYMSGQDDRYTYFTCFFSNMSEKYKVSINTFSQWNSYSVIVSHLVQAFTYLIRENGIVLC